MLAILEINDKNKAFWLPNMATSDLTTNVMGRA
jgi:hypothetical protein